VKRLDRQLLSGILAQMRSHLEKGKEIGDMKVGALLALGHQLEAIFYYLGHELGTILKVKQLKDVSQIPESLKTIIHDYNLGKVEITDSSEEIIQLKLKEHSSIKDLIGKGIKTDGSFCSFEAGVLAGIVERMINFHCFAQEVNCALQTGEDFCEFMIVFQKD
jgi:predicted hydrocarbon binding protein